MEIYVYSGIVTVLSTLLLFALALRVGLAREKHNVPVTETYKTDKQVFIVANRIHLNTLENMMLFLPLLWVATLFSGFPAYAAGVGLVWLFSRVVYAVGYSKAPDKRMYGFLGSLFSLIGLLGLCLYGFYFTLLV